MANTKISQLPSYTGSAADLRWFVMNNSGETETFKYSGYSTSITYGTGTNSIKSTNANNSLGDYSVSIGDGASTLVANQISIGKNANSGGGSDATNSNAISIGTNSINRYNDTGLGGVAIGNEADADNFIRNSVAIGYRATAKIGGVSIGDQANYGFNGDAQVAIGASSISAADGSIAVGFGCDVRADNSTAVGRSSLISSGKIHNTLIGSNSQITNGFYSFIGGVYNNITSSGGYNSIIGGTGNEISGDTSGTTIINATGITLTGSWDIVIGGNGNNYNNFGYTNNISIGGEGNVMTGTRGFKTIINGSNNEITGSAKWSSIFGGRNNRIADGDYGMTIIGGEYNYLNGCNYGSAIIGTASATMTSVGTTLLGGGYGCSVSNTNDSASLGGRNNVLSNNFQTGGSANIVGEGNNLTGNLSAIIGGNNNTITGGTHQVMIGCSGRTATEERTTYVENLRIFGQAQSNSNNVGSVTGGTRTLDFNTGNIQYFQLTAGASVVLDATNYKDGATYIVKVQQPTSGAAGTMTYTSPLFKFPSGIAPTLSTGNSNEDILTFICIGTTLYGNIVKTFI
jgi:hypothetical protein